MNRAHDNGDRLLARLPEVEGGYGENIPLAGLAWFRVGGAAEVLFRPKHRDDLVDFLKACPGDVPVTVIGASSNILVRDGGVPGVVIRMGRGLSNIDTEGDLVRAEAGAMDVNVAQACRKVGIAGLEFLRGIPGTIGGALCMNAGAYGREIKDVLLRAEAVDGSGTTHLVEAADLGLDYRHSAAPDDWIFLAAEFQGRRETVEAVSARMSGIKDAREQSQPVRSRTGGSTFKNPPGAKAWELIDRAGCRGLRRGGAQISDLHCNFLINTGTATAADLEALGEEIRRRVREATGVTLEWEVRRLGVHDRAGLAPRIGEVGS